MSDFRARTKMKASMKRYVPIYEARVRVLRCIERTELENWRDIYRSVSCLKGTDAKYKRNLLNYLIENGFISYENQKVKLLKGWDTTMQQKEPNETDTPFTPLELYGERKIEAMRELAKYVKLRNEAEFAKMAFEPKTVPHAILLAVELGGFKERMAIWREYPELVEAYDEWNQSRCPQTVFLKYGV